MSPGKWYENEQRLHFFRKKMFFILKNNEEFNINKENYVKEKRNLLARGNKIKAEIRKYEERLQIFADWNDIQNMLLHYLKNDS